MAENDILIKLKLLDEFSAELKKAQAAISDTAKKTQDAGRGMSTSIGGATTSVAGLAKSMLAAGGPILALVVGLNELRRAAVAVATEALEAERVQNKLNVALQNAGAFTPAAVAGIDAFANALLRATGQDDELTKSLVAQAVTMGASVEQSKRLVTVATDLAVITGSTESAMQMLIRAMDGDVSALKRFGIEVSDAEVKTGNFEAVFSRLEQKVRGQGVAAVNTLGGQFGLLKEQLLNLSGSVTSVAMPALTSWVKGINDAIAAHHRMTAAVSELADVELRSEMMRLQRQKAQAGTLGHFDTDMVMVESRIAAVQEQLNANAGARRDARLAGGAADTGAFGANAKSIAAAVEAEEKAAKTQAEARKKATEEYAKLLDSQYKTGTQAIEENTQALRDNFFVWKQANDEQMKTDRERQNQAYDRQYESGMAEIAANVELQRNYWNNVIKEETDAREQYNNDLDQQYQNGLEQIERETEERRLYLADWTESGRKSIEAGEKADMVKVQAAYAYAQVMIGLAKSIASGDMTGAAGGVGTMMMMYGAGSGNAGLFAAGASLATLSQLGGDGTSNTAGGRGKSDLAKVFEQAGVKTSQGIGKEDDAYRKGNVGNSGDAFRLFAEALVGQDKAGEGAEMVAGYFDALAEKTGRLSLTTGEQNDAMGDLLAMTKGLTAAEGEYQAAMMRLRSMDEMSAEQFNATLESLKDSDAAMKERQRLEEKFTEDLKTYLEAEKGSKEEFQAKVELGGDRTLLIEQMKKDRADAESWEKEMLEQGITPADTAALTDGVDGTNLWLEQIYNVLAKANGGGYTTTPDVTSPFGNVGGAGGSGRSVINVTGVVGDPTDVIRAINKAQRKARRRRVA